MKVKFIYMYTYIIYRIPYSNAMYIIIYLSENPAATCGELKNNLVT